METWLDLRRRTGEPGSGGSQRERKENAMKRLACPLPPALVAVAALGVLLVSSGVVQAQSPYNIQKIARLGEMAGDTLLPSGASSQFIPAPLNDSGQLLFIVRNPSRDLLFQYADGQFTLIAATGLDGPIGKWPKEFGVITRLSMNQSGNVVFVGGRLPQGTLLGTFLWEAKARTFTTVALKDMPATGDLTFTIPGGIAPAINNPGDIVLVGSVKGPTRPAGNGIFFLGRDQKLQPVLLTGQDLPGGGKAASSDIYRPSITDSGVVAFVTQRQGQANHGAYLWEQGTLTPLLLVGTEVPGVGKIVEVSLVVANNKNRDVLVSARVSGSSVAGLYRVADGKVFLVAVPGQEMPGGGKLKTADVGDGPSQASQAGEYVFPVTLDDGATALYQVDAAGNLSLVLKSGTPTELGTITKIRRDLGGVVNSKGQVALVIQIDNGPDTLVLLTPTVP
jgi:hypothetical protein